MPFSVSSCTRVREEVDDRTKSRKNALPLCFLFSKLLFSPSFTSSCLTIPEGDSSTFKNNNLKGKPKTRTKALLSSFVLLSSLFLSLLWPSKKKKKRKSDDCLRVLTTRTNKTLREKKRNETVRPSFQPDELAVPSALGARLLLVVACRQRRLSGHSKSSTQPWTEPTITWLPSQPFIARPVAVLPLQHQPSRPQWHRRAFP